MTDGNGNAVWKGRFSAFGQMREEWLAEDASVINQPLRFQGEYADKESGFYYNLNRYYDPGVGRYLTPDPVKLDGGLNSYQYVDGNPVNWIDPLGLSPNFPKAAGQEYLYRGDTRTSEVIFNEGFEPFGDSTDLLAHAWDNRRPPSIYVSTSVSTAEATKFATQFGTTNGSVYTMRGTQGIDVNKVLGTSSPYPDEVEMAVFGKISPDKILGATPVNPDESFVGHTILNPKVYLPKDKVDKLMKRDIELILNGAREKASIEYITEDTCSLTVKLRDSRELTSNDYDIFQCLSNIRNENTDIIFLCKGAKRNVYPSNMTRQMARGVIAYEYKNSEHAKNDCLVNIFDFDDVDVDTTPKEQELNHKAWIESLRK